MAAVSAAALPASAAEVVRIDDLDPHEDLRVERLRVLRPLTLHVHCEGAGDGDAEDLYAYGWILNAATREIVWALDPGRSRSDDARRVTEDRDIVFQPGDYEAWYAAFGEWRSRWRIIKIMGREIARIEVDRSDSKRLLRDAKHWGLVLETKTDRDLAGVEKAYPRAERDPRTVVQLTGLHDDEFVKRGFTLPERARVTVYCLGEWDQGNESMADGGWILEAETRRRVWAIGPDNFRHAGGAEKNKMARETITLAPGNYIVYYSTDGSHSSGAWNAPPPYDPESWGITVWTPDEALAERIRPFEEDENQKALLSVIRQGDDAWVTRGFTLARPARLRVYALGEYTQSNGFSDLGWIENFRTHERVWKMTPQNTEPAGGATKNRFADEVLSLAAGDYVVYYVTDDSHAFDSWNAPPPHDPEHWGLTLYAMDPLPDGEFKEFDPEKRAEAGQDDLVRLVRVRDDQHVSDRFHLDKPTRVHIVAVGEGIEPEMADYGWIENRRSGTVVWELTWHNSRWAGGAKKNRIFDGTLLLDAGDYEAFFVTDGSHAWAGWNAPPPEDPTRWGLTVTIDRRSR
jgi:hypothetical protein